MAGDLPRVAEILASMRKSLSLVGRGGDVRDERYQLDGFPVLTLFVFLSRQVGDVPEFRAGRQKLLTLEDRLQGMVEGSLAEALSRGGDDVEAVKKLCALLIAVDRMATIEKLFCSTRLAAVQSSWDEMSGSLPAAAPNPMPPPQQSGHQGKTGEGDVMAWLPRFLSWLVSFLEQESSWCLRVLPPQQQQLIASLCKSAFAKVSKGIKDKLAGECLAASPAQG